MKSIIAILLSLTSFLLLYTSNFVIAAGDVSGEFESSEITIANSEETSNLPLFDENSITKLYLNQYNGLEWKNTGGDWVDVNGTEQGNVPWASADVNRKSSGPIALDVTTLASAQRGKNDQLMVLAATISVQIWSSESIHGPTLKITRLDGSSIELLPVLDSHISMSTVKNINGDYLKFNANTEKAFIQFKLPKEEYKSVILEVWPKRIYGRGQIQVFNLPPQNAMFEVKGGIAQGLSSYSELKRHPDVIFVDTFDEPTIKAEWSMQGGYQPRPEKINNGFVTGEIDRERKPKTLSAINIRYFFAKHLKEEPSEIYFRYSVRFHEDFIYATQGGKLPGQAGTYNRCGWGGRKPTRDCEAWSARMSWGRPIETGPYQNLIPIGTYLYHMGQPGKYGEGLKWQGFCRMGKWCELEQYVKLNTPGQYDGILRGYHHGELVYERENIRYRDSENVRIEDAWTLVYHGGMNWPTKPIHVDLDNVVIAKKYIGLLEKTNSAQQDNGDKTSLAKPTIMSSSLRHVPLNQSLPSGGIRPRARNPTSVSKGDDNTSGPCSGNRGGQACVIAESVVTGVIRQTAVAGAHGASTRAPPGAVAARGFAETDRITTDSSTSSGMVVSAGKQPKLMAISPGTALDLGEYTCVNRVPDGTKIRCDTVTDFSRLNYDPYNHRLIMFGGGHAASGRTDIDVFDFATLKWASLYPSMTCDEVSKGNIDPGGFHVLTGHPVARHTYDMNVIADVNGKGRFMMFSHEGFAGFCHRYGSPIRAVAHFPLNRSSSDGSLWSYGQLFDGRRPPWGYPDAAEFDPISGMVIIVGRKGLWVYDPSQHKIVTWVKNNKRPIVDHYDGNLVYFPPNQRMYWFSRSTKKSMSARVFELILDRANWQNSTSVQMSTSGVPPIHTSATGFAYDPQRKRIGGAILSGHFHRFDPVGNRWSSHKIKVQSEEVTEIDKSVSHALDYNPVDNVYMFIARGSNRAKNRTWAYRDAP